MSFDIFVQDLPMGVRSVADIPDDFMPQPLGPRARIVDAIRAVAPHVDFADPEWATIDGADYSIEVSLSLEDPVRSFAFHLRGGDEGLFIVAEILDVLGFRALSTSEAGVFDIDRESEAFSKWRMFRDRAIGA